MELDLLCARLHNEGMPHLLYNLISEDNETKRASALAWTNACKQAGFQC